MGMMRLNDRHAFLTRQLPDGRIVDVQPWPGRAARIVVSASLAAWSLVGVYWYADTLDAVCAALVWDGDGAPQGARARPRLG